MKILEVYQKYQNMPQLMEHQLKVGAVAELLIGNILNPSSLILDREAIVKACLLHDIGNIVKFDLNVTNQLHPELNLGPEERQSWEKIKQEFMIKYGKDSHTATMNIIKELGVSERVKKLVDCIGFEKGRNNATSSDFNRKICAYSDMRVGPKGVASLEERMADLRVRYKNHPEGVGEREAFEQALREIEQQIFEHCKITPAGILEQAIAPLFDQLEDFEISTSVD